MEVFLALIIIAVPVIIIIILVTINNKLDNNRAAIEDLRDGLNELRALVVRQCIVTPAKPIDITETPPVIEKIPVVVPQSPKEPPVIVHTPLWEEVKQPQPVEEKAPPKKVVYSIDTTPVTTPPAPHPFVYEQREGWFDKWLRDNPDLEKFIGENLINKIGIAVLVLGIGFFVKYAIDQNWIKEIGRVCIGLFCGLVLVGLAHRLRKNYHSFSSVLVGGGLAVFYFTIALAFHEYGIISQTPAFIIMVVITVFAVLLAILYDRIELGIIATVGGFIAPFLVSNGQDNYVALFTYLSILNAGLIVLAYYKRWRVLNFIAFVFTQVIYIGWITARSGEPAFNYSGTFIFGCIFYAMFLLMNIIHHVSRGSKLKAFDFIILLSVNLCFYGAGMYLMDASAMHDYKGLFTAVLAVINLLLAWVFFKQSKADKNFIYLIIAITVTYISLAAPVQLNGHYITLFWAAETVVLLWLYQRSFIKLLKIASLIVTALMVISLLMDWGQIYLQFNGHTAGIILVIINKGFITGIVCSAAMFIVYNLLRREADTYYTPGIENAAVRTIYLIFFSVLLFITGVLELSSQFRSRYPDTNLWLIYLQLYLPAFIMLLFFMGRKMKVEASPVLRLVFPLAVIIFYLLNTAAIYTTEKQMLLTGNNKEHFMAAWASDALLLIMLYGTINFVRKNAGKLKEFTPVFTWLVSIALIIIFSLEIRNLYVWFYYSGSASVDYAENLYSKAGLSIVWGLSSFIIIWLGLSRKYKPLRIIALVLFGVTLVKLFAYDIQNVPPAGKIIAFILLGVVLLLVSFMYQRIKKILIDDKGNAQ